MSPSFTTIHYHFPSFTIIYHHSLSFSIIHCHFPPFTIIFHLSLSFPIIHHICVRGSRQQIETLQKAHNDARDSSRKLTSTVETLMASHGELQMVVEGLQTELGMRDSELGALRREKYVAGTSRVGLKIWCTKKENRMTDKTLGSLTTIKRSKVILGTSTSRIIFNEETVTEVLFTKVLQMKTIVHAIKNKWIK